MRKPISKQTLRRALERVRSEGSIGWDGSTGAVVDKVWHEIGRDAYGSRKRKPTDERSGVRPLGAS
jgi:hypothetical protein